MTFQLRARGLRTRLVHHVRLFDPRAADDLAGRRSAVVSHHQYSTLGAAISGVAPSSLPGHGRSRWPVDTFVWRGGATSRGLSERPDAGKRIEDLTPLCGESGDGPVHHRRLAGAVRTLGACGGARMNVLVDRHHSGLFHSFHSSPRGWAGRSGRPSVMNGGMKATGSSGDGST